MPQLSLIVIGTTISIQVKATHTKKKQTQQLPLNIAYQSRCSSCGNTWWLDVGYGGELWLSFDSSQSRRTSSLCCPWTASSPGHHDWLYVLANISFQISSWRITFSFSFFSSSGLRTSIFTVPIRRLACSKLVNTKACHHGSRQGGMGT